MKAGYSPILWRVLLGALLLPGALLWSEESKLDQSDPVPPPPPAPPGLPAPKLVTNAPAISPPSVPAFPALSSPQTLPRRFGTGAPARPVYVPPGLATNGASSIKGLVWDALEKEAHGIPGEPSLSFSFTMKNVSEDEILIQSVRASCGCTVPKLPSMPWRLAPDEQGKFEVVFDTRGRYGLQQKTVFVDTTAGRQLLRVKAVLPQGNMANGDRARNLMLAAADRQAVFKNNCAECHAKPAADQKGAALYVTACAICHDAPHRAAMVPDLRALDKTTDEEYWTEWITNGRDKTLMPAFAQSEGGPLDEAQIRSLVDYLTSPLWQKSRSPSSASPHERQRPPE